MLKKIQKFWVFQQENFNVRIFFSRNDMKIDLDDLLKKMIHRGPDSTKKIKLKNVLCGFNRLSIINQSSDSDQPMCDSSGRYVILFNGEIYNHNDLKKALKKT